MKQPRYVINQIIKCQVFNIVTLGEVKRIDIHIWEGGKTEINYLLKYGSNYSELVENGEDELIHLEKLPMGEI